MKVLVIGAGGVGGYFGGRLIESGADVTFLVRERRARQLAENGLVIKSAVADATLPVRTLTSADPGQPFDLVILTCKSVRPRLGDRGGRTAHESRRGPCAAAAERHGAYRRAARALRPGPRAGRVVRDLRHAVAGRRGGADGGLAAAPVLRPLQGPGRAHRAGGRRRRRSSRSAAAPTSTASGSNRSSRDCGRNGWCWRRWRAGPA